MTKGNSFITANRYYDELYLLFDVVLQNQYLKKYGASFSENFYAMKRVSTATGKPPTELPERIRSLAFLVQNWGQRRQQNISDSLAVFIG